MANRMSRQDDTAILRSGFLTDISEPLDQYGGRRNDQAWSVPVRPEIKVEIDRWENEGGRIVTTATTDAAAPLSP
jgi:hypothetical protein